MFPNQQGGGPSRPPWQQQGFNSGQRRNGPPPAKRSKSGPGPIITRYPPPPGYTGPARPPGPFQQQGWQQPQPQAPPQFGYGQPTYPGYPNQGYGQPQPYQQPAYPNQYGTANQPNPYYQQYMNAVPTAGYPQAQPQAPQGFPNAQHNGTMQQYGNTAPQFNRGASQFGGNASQANGTAPQINGTAPYNSSMQQYNTDAQYGGSLSHTNGAGLQQYGHAQSPAPMHQNATPASHGGPGPTAPWPQQYFSNPAPRHNSAPSISAPPNFGTPSDNSGTPNPSDLAYVSQEANNLETPYWGEESPFARCQNEIDPNLCIGEVVWHPALPTRRPLPATFNEAELEAIAPRPPPLEDEKSISEYFTNSRREESLLDIRQTDRWASRRNDPIFREFSEVPEEIVSPEALALMWRDRRDPTTWTACAGSPSPSPSPEPEPEPKRVKRENTVDEQRSSHVMRENIADSQDIFGNLEKALEQSNNSLSHTNHQRTTSVSQSIDRPRPMGIVRDQAQEDILASLGVTGSPKMAFQTPGPARSNNSRSNSISTDRIGQQGSFSRPPPPPPPAASPPRRQPWYQGYSDWHQNDEAGTSDLQYHHRRSGSAASNHTAAGSDFGSESEQGPPGTEVNGTYAAEDLDRTPRAGLRAENRKRGREGGDCSGGEEDSGAENETPRPGRKQARLSK